MLIYVSYFRYMKVCWLVWISFHHFSTFDDNHLCLNWSQNVENGMGANGWTMFCLSKFEVKFETKKETIFMFRVDKIVHCTMKNQWGNQYGMAFFQKHYVLNHLKSLKGWWWSQLNQIDILITILFKMSFFPFVQKITTMIEHVCFPHGHQSYFLGVGTF
jgi:hypothetical protein